MHSTRSYFQYHFNFISRIVLVNQFYSRIRLAVANAASSLGQSTNGGRAVQISGESYHGSEEVPERSKSIVGGNGGINTVSARHNLQFIRRTAADGRLGEQKSHVPVSRGMVEGSEHRRNRFLPRK